MSTTCGHPGDEATEEAALTDTPIFAADEPARNTTALDALTGIGGRVHVVADFG